MSARKSAATPAPIKLGKFEGKEVLSTRMGVHKVGDVLADALDADPQVFHHGDEVALVIRAKVTDVRHPDVAKTEGVERVHVIRATEAAVVPDEIVADQLEKQAERIRLHLEEKAGIQRIIPSEIENQ